MAASEIMANENEAIQWLAGLLREEKCLNGAAATINDAAAQ